MTIISPYSIHLVGFITETWHCLEVGPTLCTYSYCQAILKQSS